jgi:hypothetical protein
MLDLMWRHIVMSWKYWIFRAWGLRVKRYGRLLAVTGGKPAQKDATLRTLPRSTRGLNGQRRQPSPTAHSTFLLLPLV